MAPGDAPPLESVPAQPPPTPDEGPEEATNRTILRALCHLLIEKQLISREELHALVASQQGGRGGS